MTPFTFHPRALLLVSIPLVLLLWSATDLHRSMALGMAVVVYDVLSFAGVFRIERGMQAAKSRQGLHLP